MVNQDKEPRRLDRRDFLKYTTLATAGAVVWKELLNPTQTALAQEALPTDLPEHISYSEESAQTLIAEGGQVRVLKRLKRGDILQMFSQKIGAAGTVLEVDSTNNPGISAVMTIAAATEMDVEIKAYPGQPLWMAIEHTPNTEIAALANDAIVSNAVQMQRATIKGNCTPEGCQTVRRNISVGHKDADGVTRFDLVADNVVRVQ